MTDSIKRLDRLANLLVDSARGYHEASQVAGDPQLANQFSMLADERARLVDKFQEKIEKRDGDPDVSGTLGASAHRLFMNLRSLFENDTKAAIAEVERGEETLNEAFQDVLDDTTLDADVRSFIRSSFDNVRQGQERWASAQSDRMAS